MNSILNHAIIQKVESIIKSTHSLNYSETDRLGFIDYHTNGCSPLVQLSLRRHVLRSSIQTPLKQPIQVFHQDNLNNYFKSNINLPPCIIHEIRNSYFKQTIHTLEDLITWYLSI